MELRTGAFSQVRGNRGKRHSLSSNHGDTAEDLLFSEGWFRLRGRLKIRARGREACRASNGLQKRIVDIPFRCHPATCKRRSEPLNPWSCGLGRFRRFAAIVGNGIPSPVITETRLKTSFSQKEV